MRGILRQLLFYDPGKNNCSTNELAEMLTRINGIESEFLETKLFYLLEVK